ncbi:hypothetical protein Airi02_014760 [Actinoallomurus iriomotensis]|uniref:Uncharacterized protein n=1 Tax=Actinoallomurus iriomotensis TaxID=478107 RepID=A0A9W6RVS3_9ACTN|nr:hypothetical protein Airi02_014760 [Actinoallomurus iriomotensis]
MAVRQDFGLDQIQPGQVAGRGQDMGRIGALRGALTHEPCVLETSQREIEQLVGTIALGETVAEVGQHALGRRRTAYLPYVAAQPLRG